MTKISIAAGSAALAVLGGWATIAGRSPFHDQESVLARAVVSAATVDVAVLLLGVVGLLGALAVFVRPRYATSRALSVLAAVEVVALGLGLQSVSTIALLGYLVAMALPFGAVWLVVQVIRRYRRLRWLVLAALAVAVGAGTLAGVLRIHTVTALVGELAAGFAQAGPQLLAVALVAATATSWLLVLAQRVRGTRPLQVVGGWAARHRRALTIVAAAGPLPYALVRASWLTPWPLLVPGSEALPPEIRLWGLLLGGAAALGSVLTFGLIRRWSVVFPRWMPRLAGRPVPVAAAVVPGGLVAGVVTAAALPMLRGILTPGPGTLFAALPLLDRLVVTVIFPFWIWGPSLALAVWGYARERMRR